MPRTTHFNHVEDGLGTSSRDGPILRAIPAKERGRRQGVAPQLTPTQRRLLYVLSCGLLTTFLATFYYHRELSDAGLEAMADEMLLRAAPTRAFCSKKRPPMVCAHGGDSTHAPSNTAPAFQAALDGGADCVEIDAARTRDDQLVVLHVRELSQLLGGKQGMQVGDLSWAELQALRWPGGERVMTVRDAVLMTSPFVDCVTLDVKTYQDKDGKEVDEEQLAAALVLLVHTTACSNCMIWAKSDKVVHKIKELSPGQRAGYIVMNETNAAVEAGMHLPLRMDMPEVVGMHHGMVELGVLRQLHGAGKQLHAWTINDADMLRRVLDVGVDALVTNYPRMALDAIEYRMSQCGAVNDEPRFGGQDYNL